MVSALADTRFRKLHFDSIDEVVTEIESLAKADVMTTGNYSFGQILEHLARTFDIVTGHTQAPPVPFYVKIFARLVANSVINQPPKPGFKLPSKAQAVFWPTEPVSIVEGLSHFHRSLKRFRDTPQLPRHAFFGPLTQAEHYKLQCRHCELHLGFVHPKPA